MLWDSGTLEIILVGTVQTCIAPCVEGLLDPQQGVLCTNAIQVAQQARSQGARAPSAAPAVHVDLLPSFHSSPDVLCNALDPAAVKALLHQSFVLLVSNTAECKLGEQRQVHT